MMVPTDCRGRAAIFSPFASFSRRPIPTRSATPVREECWRGDWSGRTATPPRMPAALCSTCAASPAWRPFDEVGGTVTARPGTSLEEIGTLTFPRGWYLPVAPGTRQVTPGAALAFDVGARGPAWFRAGSDDRRDARGAAGHHAGGGGAGSRCPHHRRNGRRDLVPASLRLVFAGLRLLPEKVFRRLPG